MSALEGEPARQADHDLNSATGDSRARTAVSARWSLIGVVGKQVMRLGFTLAIARLLGPEEFGIASQAMVFLLLSEVIVDFGFGAALIQRKRLTDSQIAGAFWFNMALGFVLSAFCYFFAGAIAAILSTDDVTRSDLESVLRVMPVVIVARSLSAVPTAMLMRQLDFRRLAVAELASILVGGVAGVVSARAGVGFWAVVIQLIVTGVVFLVLVYLVYGRVPLLTSIADVRSLLWFGSNMFGSNMVSYAVLNADNFLISRAFGPSALAQYSLSFRAIRLPLDFVGAATSRFTLPSYSKAQNDLREVVRQVLIVTQLTSLVAFPALVAVIVWAPVAVPLVFGPEWEGAVVPMQFLAFAGAIQVVFGSSGNTLAAIGLPNWRFRLSVYFGVTTLGVIAIGVQYSVAVLTALYSAIAVPNALVMIGALARALPVRYRDFGRALAPATVSALGVIAGWYIAHGLLTGLSGWSALLLGSALGMVLYGAVLRCCWWDDVRPQWGLALRISGLHRFFPHE